MRQIIPKYQDKIAFIPVSLDDSIQAPRRFMSQNGLEFDAYYNPKGEMLASLNIRYIPTLVFVSKSGEVTSVVVGAKPEAEITKLLDALIK